jgi:hypothetical protein
VTSQIEHGDDVMSTVDVLWVVALALMKVVFCYALPTVVQGFGANETLHFRTTTFWAQLLLGVVV